MDFPSYHEYKPTNVLWYSDIPKEWKTIRLKFSTYIKGRVGWHGLNSNEFMLDGDYYLVTGTDFRGREIDWSKCYRIEEERFNEDPYIHLKDGDLLITKDGTIGKIAQVENIPYKATLNSGIFVTRPQLGFEYDTGYMYYVLTSDVFKNFVDNQKSGTTISHLYQNVFEDFEYPFPESLEEQQKIAAFLDYKTQQIDKLIEKKKSLIEKLEEKRIAVITQAVTKGLDKNVKLKPSGVDWLGDVPEHWELRRLRFLLSMNLTNGLFKKAEFWGKGKPIVNVFDAYIHGDIINEISLDRVECNEEEYEKYSALDGDFFFVRSSLKLEGVGKSATILSPKEEVVFECHLVRGRPDKSVIDPKYLNLYLNSKYAREYFVSAANVVTMATIDQMKLKNLLLAIPDLEEQMKIVFCVEKILSKIDGLSDKASLTIEKLNEYRSALITSAVTGKIDVREVKVPKESA